MSTRCGCCEGTAKSVPERIANRPGLSTLAYRVGTHSRAFETMLACLSRHAVRLPNEEIDSWLLEEANLENPRRVAKRLAAARDAAVRRIADLFDDASRTTLADEEISEAELRTWLAEKLNGLLRGKSLYTEESFGHLPLSVEIEDLLHDENLGGNELVHLNRLLVELALRPLVARRQWIRPLASLRSRDPSDPSIALLDAWATAFDVVSFYQERLANEGFLRTATERRSILELARLVGTQPRPGVASSAYLAFTLEKDHALVIEPGTRAQSTPGPGELPQPFETSEPLDARAEWSRLPQRMNRPQDICLSQAGAIDRLYLAGTSTRLRAGDTLLLSFGNGQGRQVLRTVGSVDPDTDAERTLVRLETPSALALALAFLERVHYAIERHRSYEDFGMDRGATVNRVLALLTPIESMLSVSETPQLESEEIAKLLAAELIPSLTREYHRAVEGNFRRLIAWLGSLRDDLLAALRTEPPRSRGAVVAAEAESEPSQKTVLGTLATLKLAGALARPRSLQPANALRLDRSVAATFAASAGVLPELLTKFEPAYEKTLYPALESAAVVPEGPLEVYALRVRASLFGHNAPKQVTNIDETGNVTLAEYAFVEQRHVVNLDLAYEGIRAGSWIVLKTRAGAHSSDALKFAYAGNPDSGLSLSKYGLTGKTTRIELEDPSTEASRPVYWFDDESDDGDSTDDSGDARARARFERIRTTSVLAGAERLELAEEPFLDKPPGPERGEGLRPIAGNRIELKGLLPGLEPGRWLVVSGMRVDLPSVSGVEASELVMIAGVDELADATLAGDRLHTVLTITGANDDGSTGLAYAYARETVVIYGNVVKATHGESVRQVLGSGDGSASFQRFALGRPPLTFVSVPNAAGARGELEVRVADILWNESPSLVELGPASRGYVTHRGDAEVTTVVFGDGHRGARLPSGAENVVAKYRTGIGASGNVGSGRINLLAEKPLGVKEVINPLAATGGADPEGRDQARARTPLAVMALDRLVSVEDYADFARTFAGIEKAEARLLSDGRRRVLHLTIAAPDDAAIDRNSDLYRNLRRALSELGDPRLPFVIDPRALRLIVLSARVRIGRAYTWEIVEPQIRSALLEALDFDRRRLGQGAARSEVDSAIHAVRGVEYADVDVFDAIDEEALLSFDADLAAGLSLRPAIAARAARFENGDRLPAQLVYLSDEVRDTLLLAELEP